MVKKENKTNCKNKVKNIKIYKAKNNQKKHKEIKGEIKMDCTENLIMLGNFEKIAKKLLI